MKLVFVLLPILAFVFASCGATQQALNTILLDAPTADVEGAGDDRAKMCGTIVGAPEGSFLRVVNRNGTNDVSTIDVSLGADGFYNIMVPGGSDATYELTVIDALGNALSQTTGPLPRGERVQDADQDCMGLQSNVFEGRVAITPNTSSNLPTPVVTVEAKSFERAQLCGTFTGAPEGSFIRFVSGFFEDGVSARNTHDVSIAADGTFSGIVIGDDTTFFTATVFDAEGNAISQSSTFVLGKSLLPEDRTCPDVTNVNVDPGVEG